MHKDLNEEQLEKLLMEAPKIEDTRSKEEVFNRLKSEGIFLQNDENVEEELHYGRPTKRNFPFKRMSSFVALVAVAIIVPTMVFMLKDSPMNDEVTEIGSMEKASFDSDNEQNATDMSGGADITSAESESDFDMFNVRMLDLRKNLYENELAGEKVFNIGLSSDAAESIPVSYKLSFDQLNQLGLQEGSSYLQIYEAIAPSIDEEALGFNEMHPLKGKLIEDGRTLIHQLPPSHSYDGSSAQMANYFGVMQDTFGGHYDYLVLQDEEGNPIKFSEVGIMNEPISLKGLNNRMNYFKYTNEIGITYLTPNFRKTFETIEDAFAGLNDEWNDIYTSAMIDSVTFTIEKRKDYVAVMFDQPLDVTLYPGEDLMLMFEAIILTAAGFDQQVKFENIMQASWGGFEFSEIIPKVKGTNELPFFRQ